MQSWWCMRVRAVQTVDGDCMHGAGSSCTLHAFVFLHFLVPRTHAQPTPTSIDVRSMDAKMCFGGECSPLGSFPQELNLPHFYSQQPFLVVWWRLFIMFRGSLHVYNLTHVPIISECMLLHSACHVVIDTNGLLHPALVLCTCLCVCGCGVCSRMYMRVCVCVCRRRTVNISRLILQRPPYCRTWWHSYENH